MEQLTQRPPVRTGKCSLILVIDGRRYRITPGEPTRRGAKIWRLRVCPGQTRAGQLYSVCSVHGHIDCTCPDSTVNFAVCKHARALTSAGSGREERDAIDHDGLAEHTTLPPSQAAGTGLVRARPRGRAGLRQGPSAASAPRPGR